MPSTMPEKEIILELYSPIMWYVTFTHDEIQTNVISKHEVLGFDSNRNYIPREVDHLILELTTSWYIFNPYRGKKVYVKIEADRDTGIDTIFYYPLKEYWKVRTIILPVCYNHVREKVENTIRQSMPPRAVKYAVKKLLTPL